MTNGPNRTTGRAITTCPCIDEPQTALLAGPFSSHSLALSWVEKARKVAQEVDPKAFWYAFGTCRMEAQPYGWKVGVLNERLGIESSPTSALDRTTSIGSTIGTDRQGGPPDGGNRIGGAAHGGNGRTSLLR